MTTSFEAVALDRDIIQETRKLVLEAVEGRNISVYLCGSRAVGREHRFSDIDIALDGHGDQVSGQLMGKLKEKLEQSHIPYRVDVIDLALASETLRQRVVLEGQKWTE